jgi:hypothetical protein
VIPGHISDDDCQAASTRCSSAPGRTASATAAALDMMAIDAGAWKSDVRDYVKKHPQKPKVIMVRGVGGDGAPDVAVVKQERDRDGALIKYQRRFWNVGAAPLKASLYKNLARPTPPCAASAAIRPACPTSSIQQLTAERRVAHYSRTAALNTAGKSRRARRTKCSTPRSTPRPPRSSSAGSAWRPGLGRARGQARTAAGGSAARPRGARRRPCTGART